MVIPDSAGRDARQSAAETAGHRSPIESASGNAVAHGDSIQQGLEGLVGHGHDRNEPGRLASEEGRSASAAGGTNAWSDFDILPFRDGKFRRIKSRDERLAYGFPDGVDAGWLKSDGSIFPLAKNIKGRVGLLKGFGNAINPWLAAEFIKAYVSCR